MAKRCANGTRCDTKTGECITTSPHYNHSKLDETDYYYNNSVKTFLDININHNRQLISHLQHNRKQILYDIYKSAIDIDGDETKMRQYLCGEILEIATHAVIPSFKNNKYTENGNIILTMNHVRKGLQADSHLRILVAYIHDKNKMCKGV